MDINYLGWVMLAKFFREDLHVTRQDEEISIMVLHAISDYRLGISFLRRQLLKWNSVGLNKITKVGMIREYNWNFDGQLTKFM